MDIKKNYFEFIGLPESFDIDLNALAEQSRELQKTLHPDRYSHLSAQEQRVAVQYTAYLNEGIATLRSPLMRAQYLLILKGIDTTAESSAPIDHAFLMQQMELREKLEDTPDADDPYSELESLESEVGSLLTRLRDEFAQSYKSDDLPAATVAVRKMQFLEKLVLEIQRLEDRLDG